MPVAPDYQQRNLQSVNEKIHITLCNSGKRFNRDWIFRNINYKFEAGKSYAITGPNGSGKSTLLQTISGAVAPNEGTIEYGFFNDKHRKLIHEEAIYQNIAIVAPYLELIEEMTAVEFLKFHSSFKPLITGITAQEILEITGLKTASDKQIRFYSSGMKQRLKLAQAIFSNVPFLLLDEPCTNLDSSGYVLYHQLIKDFCKNRLVIIGSNDINEYDFSDERLNILDYK